MATAQDQKRTIPDPSAPPSKRTKVNPQPALPQEIINKIVTYAVEATVPRHLGHILHGPNIYWQYSVGSRGEKITSGFIVTVHDESHNKEYRHKATNGCIAACRNLAVVNRESCYAVRQVLPKIRDICKALAKGCKYKKACYYPRKRMDKNLHTRRHEDLRGDAKAFEAAFKEYHIELLRLGKQGVGAALTRKEKKKRLPKVKILDCEEGGGRKVVK